MMSGGEGTMLRLMWLRRKELEAQFARTLRSRKFHIVVVVEKMAWPGAQGSSRKRTRLAASTRRVTLLLTRHCKTTCNVCNAAQGNMCDRFRSNQGRIIGYLARGRQDTNVGFLPRRASPLSQLARSALEELLAKGNTACPELRGPDEVSLPMCL